MNDETRKNASEKLGAKSINRVNGIEKRVMRLCISTAALLDNMYLFSLFSVENEHEIYFKIFG